MLGAVNTHNVLNLSKAGKQLDVDKLVSNLKCVIRVSQDEMNQTIEEDVPTTPTPLSQERLDEQKKKILDLVAKETAR